MIRIQKKVGDEPAVKKEAASSRLEIPVRVSQTDSMAHSTDLPSTSKMVRGKKGKSLHPVIEKRDGKYIIQVGSFKSKVNAMRLVTDIKPLLPVDILIYLLDEHAIFKVQTSSFGSYQQAARVMQLIMDM